MRQFLSEYLLPLIIAFAVFMGLILNNALDHFFKAPPASAQNKSAVYAYTLVSSPAIADRLLMSGDSSDQIFLFGSSELTGADGSWPYHFISDRFATKVIGVGHAGNQCFSIFTQLLANKERLKDAPIVIMVSPTWFQGKDALGTSSQVFLEFVNEQFLRKITNSEASGFKQYFGKRLAEMYDDFTSPSLALKGCYYDYQASKSIFHQPIYGSFTLMDRLLESLKSDSAQISDKSYSRKKINPDQVSLNWDSLFRSSKEQQLKLATNNSWGVNNEYYSTFVNGKHSEVNVVSDAENIELADFCMMVKLLRHYNANASFVIAPMNPYFYSGMDRLETVINQIRTQISSNRFACLDMWVSDTTNYEKGLLRDVMHIGPYGWYKIDRFIIENYRLNK